MKLNTKLIILSILIFLVAGSLNSFAQIEVPFHAELPAALTNPGQSPESAIVSLLAKRMGIELTYKNFLKTEDLEGMKTLILIIGGSGKGLGSAGVDLDAEVMRAEALIEATKEKGIKIIGMHIGGKERLGDNSMVMIDVVTPECDYVVVREDGNENNLFTNLCKENDIPLTLIKKTTDVSAVLAALFQTEEVEAPCESTGPQSD